MMQFFSGLFSQNEEPFLDDQNKKDLSQDIIIFFYLLRKYIYL